MTDDPTHPAKARRPRPAPPVIDLSAEPVKVKAEASPDEPLPEQEGAAVPPARRFDARLMASVLAGGIAGGLLVASGLYLWSPPDLSGERIFALESALEKSATKDAVATLDQRLAKAEAALADTRRLLGQPSKNTVDLSPLTARIAALEDGLARAASSPVPVTGPSSEIVARLTLAALIDGRVKQGVPFSREFDALVAMGGSPAGLDRLKPFAGSGVLSFEALRKELAQAVPSPKSPDVVPVTTSTGFGDRVIKSLSHFVTISEVTSSSDAPVTGLRDIDAALTDADGAKALGYWQALPEAQRDALKDWSGKMEARLSAEQAADALLLTALEGLKGKGATP